MDIVEEMRGFEVDHEPDGWPAIQMKQVSALCYEIERLRTHLKASQEQEPVGYICKVAGYLDFEEWISGDTKDEIRENFYKKKEAHEIVDNCIANPERWSEPVFVYAAPVPAQQSPAVAVTESVVEAKEKLENFLHQNTNWHPREWAEIQGFIDGLAKSKSPRITEQDAREIIKSFEDFADEDESAYEESAWLTYMAWSGRALLNKLNANAVAEVRQEPIYMWRLEDDGWMECTKDFFYSPMVQEYEKRIVYADPQPSQAEAMPEYLSAIEVLRENIRNPDRGVEHCGIFDNHKTRAAIGTLLSAAPKPE